MNQILNDIHVIIAYKCCVLMSVVEKTSRTTTTTTTATTSCSVLVQAREMDPLLKDLNEKKESCKRSAVSLAAQLKEARSRLATQEQYFVKESLTRQEAEIRAKQMEEQIGRLQKSLDEKNGQLQGSACNSVKYLKELDTLRSQLAVTQATADASAASAQSAQLQCLTLLKELEEKNISIKEYEDRVTRLGEQLDNLQKDLQARESSQKQLKDEVLRIERDIMETIANYGVGKDCELRKLLDEVSPKNIEKLNKLLISKDDEISKLRDEIRILNAHWKLKSKEMEAQLEKQRRADQELKKRVVKLEFCLQETRAQTRKLQRMGQRREKALKELQDQLAAKQVAEASTNSEKQNFWESTGFKVMVSVSMLVMVVFSKR